MCGRFALSHRRELVEDHFGVAGIEPFPPRYNIAPTQPVLIVAAAPSRPRGSNLPEREAMLVRWGLLPSWVKEPRDFPLLINARSETVAVKASFRAAMRHRRCIIPASGFYEWQRDPRGKRSQPYWIRSVQHGLVGFAGLWETWMGADGSEIDTCAILTAAAGDDVSAIHDRVPVALDPPDYGRWLDCRTHAPADVADLMTARPGLYAAAPVSEQVNKVANDGPDLQVPREPPMVEADNAAPQAQLSLL